MTVDMIGRLHGWYSKMTATSREDAVVWYKPADKLPDDGQECLLIPVDDGDSILTLPVFGPITWSEKGEWWIDIFRDPEAGTVIPKDRVGLWTDWAAIKPSQTP